MSLYNADGVINLTAVDGSTYVGNYAADGSLNIVTNDGSSYTGLKHLSGAFNAVVTTDPYAPAYNANGSWNVIAGQNTPSGYTVTPLLRVQSGPGAPILTWDGNTADTTPDFDVDLPLGNGPPTDAEVDDVLRVQYQLASGGVFSDYLEHIITQSDLDGNPTTQSGLTPLASESYKFRARLERGATLGSWSALEDVTIAAAVPVNSVAPVISGNTQVGQLLTTTDGTWSNSPTSYSYQWKRAGVNITSATANTYTLVEADAGAAITCDVTASNAGGAGTAAASNSLTIDVYVVYLTHIEDSSDASTYNGGVWNGVNLGVAAANRKIVVGFVARTNSTAGAFLSASLDSIGMTSAVSATAASGQNKADILIIDKTTGTTGNLSITYSTTQQRCGAGVWAIYGAGSSTPSNTQSPNTGAGAVSSATLTIPARGVAIGTAIATGSITATWSGLTENYDTAVEATVPHTGASINSNAGSNGTVSCTWSANPSTVGIAAFASWGP